MSEVLKPEFKQITPDDMFKLDASKYIAEQKVDGFLIYAIRMDNRCALYSDRMVDNTSKYPHIAQQLGMWLPKDSILVGEMHIPGGNVFDICTKANYTKAHYCVFDINRLAGENVKAKTIEERKELIAKLIPAEWLPATFNGYCRSDGTDTNKVWGWHEIWNWVIENKHEGLVLKPKGSKYGEGWLKCKLLQEVKIRILAFDPKEGKKGAFILDGGNRCDALSSAYVQQFMDIQARGKTAMGEVEYAFLSKDGHLFQPRLRLIVEV